MNYSKLKIIIVDGLVGNDYSTCLASGLSSAGVKISLVVPENRKVYLSDNNVEVYAWAPTKDKTISRITKFSNYCKYLLKLFNLINKNKPRIVHYQFFRRKEDIIFLLFLKLTGIKIVYTAHNILPHERTMVDFYLYKLVYLASNKIIVHSDYIKNKLLLTFNISEKKVEVIPHGNFDIYLPKNDISKSVARIKLNLNETDDVILFFGYIREYKGLDLLLEAIPIAIQKNPKIKLIIAGMPANPELKERYTQMIESLNCKEQIIYKFSYIPSDDIAGYFSASDLVILPYKNIDHSGIVHLAYSFARPILATNVGDFSEIIEEKKSGFLVEKDNYKKLADAINNAFADKNILVQMGFYAKELNRTKYSWDEIGKRTMDIYHNIFSE